MKIVQFLLDYIEYIIGIIFVFYDTKKNVKLEIELGIFWNTHRFFFFYFRFFSKSIRMDLQSVPL
jgi:hypothetical protein